MTMSSRLSGQIREICGSAMLRGLAVVWLASRKRKSGGIRVRCSHVSKLLVRLVSVASPMSAGILQLESVAEYALL